MAIEQGKKYTTNREVLGICPKGTTVTPNYKNGDLTKGVTGTIMFDLPSGGCVFLNEDEVEPKS